VARRSAGNQRYRKDASVGSTRRSAASAKPKRDVGEAPVKGRSSAGKGDKGKVDWRAVEPQTREFKMLRRIWFVLLGIAIVASLGGYLLRTQETLATVTLVIAYTTLFGAFGIDLLKIRPMRKQYLQELKGGDKKEKASSDEGKAD
jgi:hypothetical protein